ncbi:coiled-coil domain-containing protein 141 isoform X2 [Siniperca chuatsi]|uniref:coiled-coil domain-containing protein 141 isoform X2 n=1 Tax=Siniperca chuatsi TaxID=119488 RepID=UPI001CE1402E|nr:coiled-coil domain-containing protein 141 isoform X2 [Siniperca chuatsi]
MMTGETEETCGGQKKAGRRVGGGEGNMTPSLSFTTLSTIAIQAGQSLIVVSVLKSGSLVHLQLVQVHPGLCEIGSNQEENQTLIQDQQQLMEKLKKHESEVLSVVDKRRRRRDEGMMEQKRNNKQEEEEEVYKAMVASLKEGWWLLLRLLERRQEVLTLAADFYRRALEFAVSIDRVEDLQIRPDNDRLTEVQLTYDSMRRDLLGKSLQVLTSSSVLMQKLRQLQRTEALQRRGGVLQDEEEEEEESSQSSQSSQSSRCSRGMALRLEELVETLQDRRRRADQAVRLQLQRAERGIVIHKKESRETGSEAERLRLSERSRKQEETKQHGAAAAPTTSGQAAGPESMLGKDARSGGDHAHQALPTNKRQQLLSSCEHLVDKIWRWVQQGGSVLSNRSEAGRQLFEAEDTLNTHLQLHTQAESAGHDSENLKQILDQIRALHTDSTSTTAPQPPTEPGRQLSPLKALTEQLKRGSTGRQTRTSATRSPPAADPTGLLSPELAGRVDLVLRELQSLNRKIDSNLQLLQPYVTFLRTAQQVEEELEELKEIYRKRPEEKEEEEEEREAGSSNIRTTTSSRSPPLQRFLAVQELGNNFVHAVTMVSGAGLNLQSVVSVVRQTVERLSRTKEEVNELLSHQKIQIQQQQEYCRKYRERLLKTLQDLNCVSELLDSCTLMDLGSDLQTSRLLERFSQARPHFIQLDAEVEYMEKSWETLRRVQDRLEVKELKGRAAKEEDLSELLKLREKVKNKIHQSESILDLTSSFHLTSKQLEALLQSDLASPLTDSAGLCGSSEADLSRHREEQQQIQSLFETASTLKTDICTAINHSGWTCFRVEQLEARLLSLDSLCVSWLNEAARREEKLRRELLARLLIDDINQLRDSFKELKKRFSNLKFNYVKRNDRTRNMKAVRNQLQQVELYEEKLQALRKRLQAVTARLGSEVKDGRVAREAEDAVNELQRQMGEFGRSFGEHQKTLEMTCRLQQAMEEYQFWCEEASSTIARVGKFSSECRSTEAASVLYRQFEKFVWPTVPQQEERISQITELAVRLHGVEEGRRYIEKTVSKHSEMVESIRQLSDGLMELEAKLKLESLKQQQSDGEKVIKTEETDEETETKLKENRKVKTKEQTDNRSTQEADMYELKETGHTPELNAEHDGKEVPVKQTAANRKPPLRKSRSQEADRQTDRQTVTSESSHRQQLLSERFTSSYCSTHTFSLSCSPVEANRRVHTIHSQLQPFAIESQATPPPSVIGPSFSDIQREFQRKETQETGQQAVSASCGSNMAPLQDASQGGLLEAELQQPEVMTEDSLSNDEYECASPDDISLPPLAETPESYMVQSDVEEGFCFSSHSVHVNQYSHQYRAQSEHSGTGTATGAVRQQRESSQSCPTPPTSFHNSTRFRSGSSSFVQSPLTVPAPSLLSSTLCSILRTGESGTANVPTSADHFLGGLEPSFPSGSNLVHKINTQDSCSNKDNDVPEQSSPSQTKPLLKEHNSQYKMSTDTQGKIIQNVASKGETLPETDPIPQAVELNHSPTLPQSSYCPQSFKGPGPDPHKDKTPPQDTRFLKCSTTLPQTRTAIWQDNSFLQSFPYSESGINSPQTSKETFPVTKLQRDSLTNTSTSTISQQTIYFQSSPSDSHCTSLSSPQECSVSQSETLPQIDPVPQARGFVQSPSLTDSVFHKDRTRDTGLLKSCATCPQTSTSIPQDSNLPQSYLDSSKGLDQDLLSSRTSKETSTVSMPQSSSLTTTTTVTQQTVYCQSFPPNSHCNVPQASSNLRSQQESPFSQGSGGLPEVHAPILPEPDSISNISTSSSTSSSTITSNNRFSSKQSHQTVYSLQKSLTSTCTQQCVHDPGMTPCSPAKPTAPLQPEAQTQALAQQANLHVTPLSSPSHLLTPDQDPNICQPMAIREEIRLTPQIQGPAFPAPPPLAQAQAESLPQGKASKPEPPCFTRPLSRATVMEGSPVTLEVEVTGHPEPALTWFKDGEVSATGPGRAPACEDEKHFLFIPDASDSDGGLYEARAANHHGPRRAAGNSSSSSDKWLVAEVFDIISVDWQTWFGTLCVLLWLLYLIVL